MINKTQDDLQIIEREHEVVILVPLYIPKSIYEMGAVDALAQFDGYQAKITGPDSVEIDNPDSTLMFNVKNIQNSMKEKYKTIMKKQGEETGRTQAEATFNSLFN